VAERETNGQAEDGRCSSTRKSRSRRKTAARPHRPPSSAMPPTHSFGVLGDYIGFHLRMARSLVSPFARTSACAT